jgi:CHAT domain-containing protein
MIVADGALQYLPFAALPDPDGFQQPLVVNHEIITVPSASTLAVLRRENADRKPAPKTLAVLADPVFSADDTRIARSGQKPGNPATRSVDEYLQRSINDLGLTGFRLSRLPGTRREAAGIMSLVAADQRIQAVDFDASRAMLNSPDMLGGTHQRPAAALREAQIAMWKTKGWDAPYYWAAFVLQGDWK